MVVSARDREGERRRRLDEMATAIRELAGAAVFADREDETLEAVVGELLGRSRRTLTTAESCTGGLLAERLTRVAGSSAYFLGGVVSYSNELKTRLLGVPAEMIAERGAVSEPVARAMAESADRIVAEAPAGLTPEEEGEFRALAATLERRSKALAEEATRLTPPQRRERLAEIDVVCGQCHARFRIPRGSGAAR